MSPCSFPTAITTTPRAPPMFAWYSSNDTGRICLSNQGFRNFLTSPDCVGFCNLSEISWNIWLLYYDQMRLHLSHHECFCLLPWGYGRIPSRKVYISELDNVVWYSACNGIECDECNTMVPFRISIDISFSNTRGLSCSRCEGVYCLDYTEFSRVRRSTRERERERERELVKAYEQRHTCRYTESPAPCCCPEGLCGYQLLNSQLMTQVTTI